MASAYPVEKMVSLGLLSTSALTAVNRKFMTYNADLVVNYIHFVEHTFLDATTNALFFPYFGSGKWVTAHGCVFELKQ